MPRRRQRRAQAPKRIYLKARRDARKKRERAFKSQGRRRDRS